MGEKYWIAPGCNWFNFHLNQGHGHGNVLGQTKWPENQFKSHTHTCTHSHTKRMQNLRPAAVFKRKFYVSFQNFIRSTPRCGRFRVVGTKSGGSDNQPSIKLNRKVSCCISNNSHYAATAAAPAAPAARGQRRGVGEGDLEEPFNHAIAPGQIANTYGKCECQVRQESLPPHLPSQGIELQRRNIMRGAGARRSTSVGLPAAKWISELGLWDAGKVLSHTHTHSSSLLRACDECARAAQVASLASRSHSKFGVRLALLSRGKISG